MPGFVREGIIMKRLFVLLLFILVPLAPIGAQGLHGKILIVLYSNSYWQDSIEEIVPTIYSGVVETASSLPIDLSGYDAVLISVQPENIYPLDTISLADEFELITYTKNGGKLYYESGSLFFRETYYDTALRAEDTLAHFLGLQEESLDALTVTYQLFLGVDSEFTQDLNVPHAHDPVDPDVSSTYYPYGNLTPVLFGEEADDVEKDIFAWVPSDSSLKVVMNYHPVFGYNRPSEYYTPFLTRVLCDYFGLCVDAVKEAPPAIPTVTLRVVNDGISASCLISVDETGSLDIANALGITVYHASVNSGTSQIELPEALRNGVYFARLQTEHGGQVQPFAIVGK
jgi:hypothetical protein